MHTLKKTTFVSAALMSLLLSACGGSGSPLDNNTGGNGGEVDTTTAQKIGSGTGSEFDEGNIGVTNDLTSLSAGGSTTLTVYIVSSTNTPVTATSSVNFISSCIAANKATLKDGAGTTVNSVSTINGRATITYTANGCVGEDRVTASASIGGVTKYANVDLEIEPGTVGSIQFTSATPAQISLKGSGGTETASIRFRVLDGNGAPVEKTSVAFTMSTTAGGLSLNPTSALSDSEGYVSTTINAGTVATVVSVTATVEGASISTSSGNLTVSTGVPVQKFASLAFSKFNPRAWDRDGEEVSVTMSMADDFGNPVADGTAVTFWAEGGLVGANCRTEDGRCSVTWRSQQFRPNDGRVTILAVASGNETFVDTNSNGRYDQGETFYDMAEAYRDDNESAPYVATCSKDHGAPECDGYNSGELFVDLADPTNDNKPNGTRDPGNGVYNGTLCYSDVATVCSKEKVTVRRSWTLSMSSPNAMFALFSDRGCQIPSNGAIAGSAGTIYVLVSDELGNSMPSETIVSIDSSEGVNLGIGDFESVVPNSPDPVCYGFDVSGTIGTAGSFIIKTETEEEEITSARIPISFNEPQSE